MTLITHLTESTEEASTFIKKGKLVAFPTETVYGLGGSALNPESIARIFQAKERPRDNPLIVHIHTLTQLDLLVKSLTPTAAKLIDAFFPGPLTVILERSDRVPDIVSAGLPSIAVRMPAHQLAVEFLESCEVPIAAPSANRSGRPSPTTWQDVYDDLKGRISCILKGKRSQLGLESTVVDCRFEVPQILRAGSITEEEIAEVTPLLPLSQARSFSVQRSPSPGVKHKHYAPRAKVHIVNSPHEIGSHHNYAYIGITPHEYPEKLGLHLKCLDVVQYAHQLFHFFRRSDRAELSDIFCQSVPEEKLGVALMDRIHKAARDWPQQEVGKSDTNSKSP